MRRAHREEGAGEASELRALLSLSKGSFAWQSHQSKKTWILHPPEPGEGLSLSTEGQHGSC